MTLLLKLFAAHVRRACAKLAGKSTLRHKAEVAAVQRELEKRRETQKRQTWEAAHRQAHSDINLLVAELRRQGLGAKRLHQETAPFSLEVTGAFDGETVIVPITVQVHELCDGLELEPFLDPALNRGVTGHELATTFDSIVGMRPKIPSGEMIVRVTEWAAKNLSTPS